MSDGIEVTFTTNGLTTVYELDESMQESLIKYIQENDCDIGEAVAMTGHLINVYSNGGEIDE